MAQVDHRTLYKWLGTWW